MIPIPVRNALTTISLSMVVGLSAAARPPEWVTALRHAPVPAFGPETAAVCLVDEAQTELTEDGEIRSRHRMAYKILSRDALDLASIQIVFDPRTRISDLRAWNLKGESVVHEIGQKEALEAQLSASSGILFDDARTLTLFIPQVEVGSIVAWELERSRRPWFMQDIWTFQQVHPVLQSRFELQLPSGWEFRAHAWGSERIEPALVGRNRWVWELRDLPGIPDEEGMPPAADLSATLGLSYVRETGGARSGFETWDDVASWSNGLIAPRMLPSPDIARQSDELGGIAEIAAFVQESIRYVAITIGIGGWQPHAADEILRNRYGDCKDKVTLLGALLKSRGIDIYPVLIHSGRQTLAREYPSPLHFDHLIAAIPVTEESSAFRSIVNHPELGKLLLFDPTDPATPFGRLGSQLQGVTAVLIAGTRAHLIDTPVTPPGENFLLRRGTLTLSARGDVTGELSLFYGGELAPAERERLRGRTQDQWLRQAEESLADWFPGAVVKSCTVSGLNSEDPVRKVYDVQVPRAVATGGDIVLLRVAPAPESIVPFPDDDRRHEYVFGRLQSRSTALTYKIPAGYEVDSLPEPFQMEFPFASYEVMVEANGSQVKYASSLAIRELRVGTNQMPQLRELRDAIERASRMVVLLKRVGGTDRTVPTGFSMR